MRGLQIIQEHPTLRLAAEPLRALLRTAAAGEGYRLRAVTLVCTGHERVLSLNRQYLQHDYHTDVLSFDLRDDPEGAALEGEVYIDLDTAAERCAEFGTSFEQEAQRYAVHGLLHLMGYDDATPEDKAAMHTLEDQYLATAAG